MNTFTIISANEFITNFFNTNPNSDYWDCTREMSKYFSIEFADAFQFVSNYVSKKICVDKV